jgi:uncharacterized membrane protein
MAPPPAAGYDRRDERRALIAEEDDMNEWLAFLTERTVTVIDGMALLIVVTGTLEAFVSTLGAMVSPLSNTRRRDVWMRFARWLVAALTFQLAADIIETSIRTDWQSIVRLGAIAVIRTFLNFFLERDVEGLRERQREATKVEAA